MPEKYETLFLGGSEEDADWNGFWAEVAKLLPVEVDRETKTLTGKILLRLEDRWGWDDLLLLPDGRVALPDRNSGACAYSSGPLDPAKAVRGIKRAITLALDKEDG